MRPVNTHQATIDQNIKILLQASGDGAGIIGIFGPKPREQCFTKCTYFIRRRIINYMQA